MSGTAERIEELIALTRSLRTEREFVAEFPHPFLVREATDAAAAAAAPPTGADRRTARVSRVAAPTGDGFAREDVWIHRVCPRDLERNDGAVTLGRDEGCDVVVDDATVSLVHARFTLESGTSGANSDPDDDDDGRRFFVVDAGSSNGTFVDGEPAPVGAPVRVTDQASVRFGPQAKFQFFTAAGFFQFMDFYRRIKKRGS